MVSPPFPFARRSASSLVLLPTQVRHLGLRCCANCRGRASIFDIFGCIDQSGNCSENTIPVGLHDAVDGGLVAAPTAMDLAEQLGNAGAAELLASSQTTRV